MLQEIISSKMLLHFIRYAQDQGIAATELLERAAIGNSLQDLQEKDHVSWRQFGQVYRATVDLLDLAGKPVPWAGGLGSQTFRSMCHCIESAKTLQEALQRASQFSFLMGQHAVHVGYQQQNEKAHLSYDLFTAPEHELLLPEDYTGIWSLSSYRTVAVCSSMQVWHMFCSWLIGTVIEIERIDLACDYISEAFHERLLQRFCFSTICYGCDNNRIHFSSKYLSYGLVQSSESMTQFLETAPYPLMVMAAGGSSTKTAVKTLIGLNFSVGCPGFNEVAERLELSPSGLRRRLEKEETSFQKIKDECRRDLAINYLQRGGVTISELSEMLGFKDAGSFSRSFKQWVGVSPKAYKTGFSTNLPAANC